MALRPASLNGALGIALVLGIFAVFVRGPSLQPGGDDSGQLEGRFDDDEAVFMQVSNAVRRRSLQDQKMQVTGAAASQVAKENHAEAPGAATPHATKGDFSALQLGSKTQVMMSIFVEIGRSARSARDLSKTKLGDPMMAVTIIVFALCGVAMLVIFFTLSTDLDQDDMRVSMKRAGAHQQNKYLPSSQPTNSPQQYNRATERQKDPYAYNARYDAPQSSSPKVTQPLRSAPQGGSPGYAGQYRAPFNEQLAVVGATGSNRSSPLMPSKLSSELLGATVPGSCKFIVKIPSLLVTFPVDSARKYSVKTKDDEEMLNLKFLRQRPNPSEPTEVQIEEYMTLFMPPELDEELVVCTFGRVAGNTLICEIYKSDPSELYGILSEEPLESRMSAAGSTQTFALWQVTEPRVKLFIIVVVGKLSERKVKIFDGQNPSTEVASTVPTGATDRFYQTECYPDSDVLLVVLALAGIDRIAANTGRM